MKCDETKPVCQRCVSSGRQCEGYAAVKMLVFDPDVSAMERRYMQYFQERAAVELSEYHDAPFWNKQVLQVSHLHPAVRHCLVAIASLHESLHQGQGLSASSLMNKEMTFSLQQYNKAINLLTVRENDKPVTIDIILMACVLFICYENL